MQLEGSLTFLGGGVVPFRGVAGRASQHPAARCQEGILGRGLKPLDQTPFPCSCFHDVALWHSRDLDALGIPEIVRHSTGPHLGTRAKRDQSRLHVEWEGLREGTLGVGRATERARLAAVVALVGQDDGDTRERRAVRLGRTNPRQRRVAIGVGLLVGGQREGGERVFRIASDEVDGTVNLLDVGQGQPRLDLHAVRALAGLCQIRPPPRGALLD